ncbi:30S ribosomal protein S20 [Candidatus Similichlamydia laticola]|uniref:Small ribosomal subunit protein bS20 n=1 Tax=Candidatus Similichlamydia laticola TaxID=2170265 RepID=A0A369KH74_9BACT|nr:30S ribosomal protein S20 [Candidatus Similichlamydia laticola]RDB31143.1 SSU ribosomal protein S20p [Candidatus Similichlamydia laticola]
MQREEGKKVKKQTSAEKRIVQAEKKRQCNRAAKSRIHTSVRALLSFIQKNEESLASEGLSRVFSLLDKGLKTGLLKKNRVSRVKSKLSKKTHSLKACGV